MKKLFTLIAGIALTVGLFAPPAAAAQQCQVATGYSNETIYYNEPGFPTSLLIGYSNANWKGTKVRGYILCHNVPSATLYWAFSVWKLTNGSQFVVSCNGGDYIWLGTSQGCTYYNSLWGMQYG